MLSGVQSEALSRLSAAKAVLRVVDAHEKATGGGDDASRSLKGLIFVHNYAAYEYVVVESVRLLIALLNSKGLAHSAVRAQLLGMSLHPEFDSVINGAIHKTWAGRSVLLVKARSSDPVVIADGLFPKDGSHFRPDQLTTLWTLFGIPGDIVADKRHLGIITEMVETRNRIAHGNEAASKVGGGFSVVDLTKRVADTEAICAYITSTISAYAASATAFT